MQRHKFAVTKVYNAKKGRDSCAIQIYGMEGIPTDIIEERIH